MLSSGSRLRYLAATAESMAKAYYFLAGGSMRPVPGCLAPGYQNT